MIYFICSMTLHQKKIIGIPRALSYYNNYPFYYGFFKSLGYDIVLSDKTTSMTINTGAKFLVSDTCLPIKVYLGHLINLLERGVDTIFVPSLISTAYKINNCSKIRGLPEIVRNVVDKPFMMIEPTLDKTEGITLKDFCNDIASQLNVFDKEIIKSAIDSGWKYYNLFIQNGLRGLSFKDALNNALLGKLVETTENKKHNLSVVIMAHGYNLYDERISLNLLNKLDKMGVKVYTSLNITKQTSINAIKELGEIQYWANELDLTGTAAYYMLNKKVDGIIALSAFGCGPDSLMVNEIEYHANLMKMPLIHLNIDEHTGEAGFVTRLEAFIDMLERKKRLAVKSNVQTKQILSNVNEEKVLVNV